MHNVRHKRQQHTLNTLRPLLKHNNSTIVKPDKSKAIVIINKYNRPKNTIIHKRKQHTTNEQGSNRKISKTNTKSNSIMHRHNRENKTQIHHQNETNISTTKSKHKDT